MLASAITAIANFAQFAAIFGGRSGDGEERGNPLAMLLMALLAPMAAGLIQMAISRTREYKADATGASFCRDPLALASALDKLTAYSRRIPMQGNPSTENMFIVSPFSGRSMANLFSTHPPMEERVARLREMARGGVQSAPADDFSSPGSGEWDLLNGRGVSAQKSSPRPEGSGWERLMNKPGPSGGSGDAPSGWERFRNR